MRPIVILTLVACVFGCTTFSGNKTNSSWYALQKATKVSCSPWPLRDKDLEIDELSLIPGPSPLMAVSGLKRDASPLAYLARLPDGTKVDEDAFLPLELGRHAVLVGGTLVRGTPWVMVVRNAPGKATLEVRSIPDNVIQAKVELGGINVVEGTTASAKGAAWTLVKDEDNVYHVIHVRFGQKTTGRVLTGLGFKERPVLIATANKAEATLLWKEGEAGRPFHAQVLGDDDKAALPVTLNLQIANQAESWAAAPQLSGRGLWLAAIDGDSLVGSSDLKIEPVNPAVNSAPGAGVKSASLRDVHSTEPVLLATDKGEEALLLNWIDDESTIARYMVAGSTLAKPVYSGIYPKGSRIAQAYRIGDSNYVVIRHRDESRWAYEICEI